jgi:energy-coupling factor transporter transmembrane protein EcfT
MTNSILLYLDPRLNFISLFLSLFSLFYLIYLIYLVYILSCFTFANAYSRDLYATIIIVSNIPFRKFASCLIHIYIFSSHLFGFIFSSTRHACYLHILVEHEGSVDSLSSILEQLESFSLLFPHGQVDSGHSLLF